MGGKEADSMKEMGWWILDENHTPQYIGYDLARIQRLDYHEHIWKRVEQTWVGPYRVSTVFLGIDHNFFGEPPLLFETMVFLRDNGRELDTARYASWNQAVEGHHVMVKEVEKWGWGRRWRDEWDALCVRYAHSWRILKQTLRGNRPGSGSSLPKPTRTKPD